MPAIAATWEGSGLWGGESMVTFMCYFSFLSTITYRTMYEMCQICLISCKTWYFAEMCEMCECACACVCMRYQSIS